MFQRTNEASYLEVPTYVSDGEGSVFQKGGDTVLARRVPLM